MKSWEEKWLAELDEAVPPLREDVLLAEIPKRKVAQEVKNKKVVSSKSWFKETFELLYTRWMSMPKRWIAPLATGVAGVAIITGALVAGLQPGPITPSQPIVATADVISVEINPQAIFRVDKNGNVTAVVALNDEADIVLADNRYMEMQDLPIEESMRIFVDYTAQLGFLNLDEPGAVRLSSCAENGYIDKATQGLETYFQSMGAYIAVAEETLQINEFCARVQMDIFETVESLKMNVERIPALLLEREASGKTEEELAVMYRENVPMEEVKNLFLEGAQKGVDKMDAIKEISALAKDIFEESDSFLLFRQSYWDLLEKKEEITNTKLLKLMRDMEGKLLAYELSYGVRLESGLQVQQEMDACHLESLTYLTEILIDCSLEVFAERFDSLMGILDLIGIDTTKIKEFYTLPTTVEEYLEKLQNYASERYQDLKETGKEIYNHVREELSPSNYSDYMNVLIAEYGSLNDYFVSLRSAGK